MLEAAEFLSCDPLRLYADRPFNDPQLPLERLAETAERHRDAIEVVAEIYPPISVTRAPPAVLAGPNAAFCEKLRSYYARVDGEYARIAPSILVRIRDAIVWDNMLFAVANGRVLPIYEFYRPTDRNPKGSGLVSRLAACDARDELDFELGGALPLFVGSAGSFNYGHWLVDDLPSLACGVELCRTKTRLSVLMSGYENDLINFIRSEGTSAALRGLASLSIRYLTRGTAYRVKDLHYVTPVSYHGFQKHPLALRYLRELFEQVSADRPALACPEKIFVGRPPGDPRTLVNRDAVFEVLSGLGFVDYRPDTETLLDQWTAFAGATQIVGIMGAAMTSTVFSKPGSAVTHLAASGWMEPFYWDLAAMREQRYHGLFGPDVEAERGIHLRSFSIDPDLLAQTLSGRA